MRALALVALLAAAAHAEPGPPPADLKRFIDDAAGCEHWSGEYPDMDTPEARKENAGRAKQVMRAMTKLCDPLEAREKRLRKKYAARQDLLCLIDQATQFLHDDRIPNAACSK